MALQLRNAGLGLGRGRHLIIRPTAVRIFRLLNNHAGALRPPLRRPAPRAAYASAADSSYDSDADHAASQPAIGAMSEEHRVVVVFEEMSKEQMLELLTRLNENDVEYNELKHLCKDNMLGGKDMKYNLRAKLIREARRRLGMAVWDKASYARRRAKRPRDMTIRDLERFYRERGVMLPDDHEEAVGLAYAMLVVDGVLDAEEVPSPSFYEKYSHKSLGAQCAARALSTKGTKAELAARLTQHDAESQREALALRAERAAGRELAAASIDAPPRPPNRELARDLAEAQAAVAAVGRMELPDLRVALLARRLPIYGTREVLVDRVLAVLRRDVVEAHAGQGRLEQYAAAAVAKLAPEGVLRALAERGLPAGGAREEPRGRLAATLVDDWVQAAMAGDGEGGPGAGGYLLDEEELLLEFAEGVGEEEEDDEARRMSGYESGEERQRGGAAAGEDDAEFEAAAGAGGDPTLEVALVCEGLTPGQRDAALASARAALPHLQSDMIWGTLRSYAPLEGFLPDDAPPPGAGPPSDPLSVLAAVANPNALAVEVDLPLAPPGCVLSVRAAPVDGGGGGAAAVTAESADAGDLQLHGLRPGTTYELSARLRNEAGYGPEGEVLLVRTYDRQGVAVRVLYPVPGGAQAGERRYVQLSWEELHACSAAELDARLDPARGGAAPAAAPLARWAAAAAGGGVMLPLGLAPGGAAAEGACVGSWGAPAARALEASRPAFARAARGLGFPAADLLELSAEELAGAGAGAALAAWLGAQGLDPELTRVAVRVEAGGEVLAGGVGRGVAQVAAGAAAVAAATSASSVVLEAVHPGAVHFTCAVLGTPAGAMALPPTEVGYYDVEEDVDASELQYERFWAVRQGKDGAAVDALSALWLEERRQHPALLGGAAAAPTQQLRHATPPASLGGGVAEGIRAAAARLFADLGLQDFAQFSGWVVPQAGDPQLARGAALLADLRAGGGEPAPAAPSSARPFSELLELDAAERAAAARRDAAVLGGAAAAPAGLPGGAAVDVAAYGQAADEEDAGSALANAPVLRAQGDMFTTKREVLYGQFAGFEIDGRTRGELLAETPAPPPAPIPAGIPPVEEPSSLPDLTSASPSQLCAAGGALLRFNQVALAPALAGGGGPLAQQCAAAGLSTGALTRQLVSMAAARAGLPPLGPLPQAHLDGEAAAGDEWPLLVARRTQPPAGDDDAAPPHVPSLEEIAADLEAWAAPAALPAAESYEDILAEADPAAAAAAPLERGAGAEAGAAHAPGAATWQEGGALLETDALPAGEADALGAEYAAAVLARQFPGLHPTRQRVWVLCGGEGPLRDRGLQGALHAVAALQGERDLLVETFMLDAHDAGARDEERRRVLLSRRLDLRRTGARDEEIAEEFPEFHPTRIKHPAPPPPEHLAWRGVWRLAGSPVVRPGVPDMRHGAEAALAEATVAPRTRRPGDAAHRAAQLLASVRGELAAAGVAGGGGGPWGGDLARPEAPTFCFLDDWVEAAAEQCVVVLLALPGHPSAAGPLQRLLEARGVPFTGASSVSADLCADRPELMRQLAEWFDYQDSAIKMPLHHTISLPELAAICDTEAAADTFFGALHGAWPNKTLLVRPARDAGGLGMARVACGRDVQVYAHAVREWWDQIPGEELSLGATVRMPVPPPTQFVVETVAEGEPLRLWADEAGAPLPPPGGEGAQGAGAAAPPAPPAGKDGTSPDALHRALAWPATTSNSWLEVRGCVLGGLGTATCLGLTAAAEELRRLGDGSAAAAGALDVTPPPPGVLRPEAAATARLRMQAVADRLGLSGAAQITAQVNPATGEMIVLEVDPHPDLSPGSLLLRQAALQTKTATEVMRELLRAGMSRGEGGGEGGGGGGDAAAAPFFADGGYAADTAAQAGAEVQVPSPGQTYYGTPYMVVEDEEEGDEEGTGPPLEGGDLGLDEDEEGAGGFGEEEELAQQAEGSDGEFAEFAEFAGGGDLQS